MKVQVLNSSFLNDLVLKQSCFLKQVNCKYSEETNKFSNEQIKDKLGSTLKLILFYFNLDCSIIKILMSRHKGISIKYKIITTEGK